MELMCAVEAGGTAGWRIAAVISACVLLWGGSNEAAAQNYVWTTFVGRAGNTNGGDGVGTNAFFNQPTGGAMDAAANFYVPDEYNNAIRKVAPDGTVTTFAGKLGVAGTNDGTGGAARFTQPTNLTFDNNGNMYVVDTYAHTIRKITPAGVVTTLAGLGDVPGFSDGTGSAARFNQPNGIGYDTGANVLYVADGENGAIRKVTLSGVVTTIAGGGTSPGHLYYGVEQVAVNSSHLVYVLDAYNSTIWTMNTNGGSVTALAGPGAGSGWPVGSGSADGTGSAARFSFPESLWLDAAGNAFVADYSNDTIRKVTPAGVVTTVGGQPGVIGTANGTNTAALFNLEEGIFVDPWGNLYVADTQSSTIRVGYAGPPAIVGPPQSLTVAVGASPSFTVTAGGAAPKSAYQWRFNGVALTNNAHISGAQSNLFTVTSVTTNDAGTYQVIVTNAAGSTNVSATLTVTQMTPVITWTNPAAITYATALGSSQLNATANVPGSFLYTPAAGTVLSAGTNALTTVFTPTDIVDYSSATGTVSQVVLRAALTATASNAFRLYGQTNPGFGGTLTGIQNADNITATYATAATNTSPVGTYAIIPTLMDPNGRLPNYTVTTNNGVLTVNKATPTITNLPTATAITYGQTLASSTLSGWVVSVPGLFGFTTPSAAPDAGTALQSVTFTPTDTTNYNTVATNVSVTVGQATPLITWSAPASIAYGTGLSGVQLDATANVPGSFLYAPAAGTVLSAGTNTLTTVFTPTNTLDYSGATGAVSLVVSPVALSVTASNAFRLYGQANPGFGGTLAGIQNADNITATYATVATTASPVGTYAITPTLVDPNGRLPNYTVTTNNGVLTVNKATPTITNLPTATAITYGQTLASSTLSGWVVSVPGIFGFTTPSAAPDAGTALQSVTFTPTDTTNYNTVATNVSVTVGQATPLIIWSAPASINYGTGLSGVQLDATASVPGSFLYAPASGTVLSAGTNTLTTVFTPTNTLDYSGATGTVSLVVSPVALSVTANDAWRAYGATNPVFTVTYSGFVNGDSLTNSDVAGAPLLATPADTNSPVGMYAISNGVGTLTSTNYTFALTNGTLTVTAASLTITANDGTKVYGQTKTFAGTEFTASGLRGTDSVTGVALASLGAPGTAAVGEYPILASGATGSGLGNYTLGYVAGVLTVTPATPVTINSPMPLGDGTIALTFAGGDAGVSYRIQANSDLTTTNWGDVSTNLAGTNGLPSFTDLNAINHGSRFYRVVTP